MNFAANRFKKYQTLSFLSNFYENIIESYSNEDAFWAPYISTTTQLLKLKFFVRSHTSKFYSEKNFRLYRLSPSYFKEFTI
jgi:hypothetical protein